MTGLARGALARDRPPGPLRRGGGDPLRHLADGALSLARRLGVSPRGPCRSAGVGECARSESIARRGDGASEPIPTRGRGAARRGDPRRAARGPARRAPSGRRRARRSSRRKARRGAARRRSPPFRSRPSSRASLLRRRARGAPQPTAEAAPRPRLAISGWSGSRNGWDRRGPCRRWRRPGTGSPRAGGPGSRGSRTPW